MKRIDQARRCEGVASDVDISADGNMTDRMDAFSLAYVKSMAAVAGSRSGRSIRTGGA